MCLLFLEIFFAGGFADSIVTSLFFLSFILLQIFLRKDEVFSKDMSDISMYDVFLALNSIM